MEKLLPVVIVFVVVLGIIGISVLAVPWARNVHQSFSFCAERGLDDPCQAGLVIMIVGLR